MVELPSDLNKSARPTAKMAETVKDAPYLVAFYVGVVHHNAYFRLWVFSTDLSL